MKNEKEIVRFFVFRYTIPGRDKRRIIEIQHLNVEWKERENYCAVRFLWSILHWRKAFLLLKVASKERERCQDSIIRDTPRLLSFKHIGRGIQSLTVHNLGTAFVSSESLKVELEWDTTRPAKPCLREKRLGGGREKTHGSSPSTSGKTNEKPSVIQTRRRQCTIGQEKVLCWAAFHFISIRPKVQQKMRKSQLL